MTIIKYPRYVRYHVHDFVCLPHTCWAIDADNEEDANQWLQEYSKKASLPVLLVIEHSAIASTNLHYFWRGEQYGNYQDDWFSAKGFPPNR